MLQLSPKNTDLIDFHPVAGCGDDKIVESPLLFYGTSRIPYQKNAIIWLLFRPASFRSVHEYSAMHWTSSQSSASSDVNINEAAGRNHCWLAQAMFVYAINRDSTGLDPRLGYQYPSMRCLIQLRTKDASIVVVFSRTSGGFYCVRPWTYRAYNITSVIARTYTTSLPISKLH